MNNQEILILTLRHQERMHRQSGAHGLADLFKNSELHIAELEKGLEIALPILRSAVKQQWDGAYNAFAICSSLLKEQVK